MIGLHISRWADENDKEYEALSFLGDNTGDHFCFEIETGIDNDEMSEEEGEELDEIIELFHLWIKENSHIMNTVIPKGKRVRISRKGCGHEDCNGEPEVYA